VRDRDAHRRAARAGAGGALVAVLRPAAQGRRLVEQCRAVSPRRRAPTPSGSTAAATHLGLTGEQLGRDARIHAVADVCETLSAERPYRAALPPDEVRAIMRRDAGRGLCPETLAALEASQELGVLTLATPATAARPAGR
jgi:hypothetical protein